MVTSIKIGTLKSNEKQNVFLKVINKFLWLFGTSRNAILVILTGIVGYHFHSSNGEAPFKLIGHIPEGLPSIQFPSFEVVGNTTATFFDMLANYGSGIIVVPLIALLENIAICKAFGEKRNIVVLC